MVRLLERRTVWWPTLLGWLVLFSACFGAAALWWFEGESFLSLTERQPPDVLVVEGWIGPDGIAAAAQEFRIGGYQYIVGTSGLTGDAWSRQRWSYAVGTEQELLRIGIPADRIVTAPPRDTATHRTFESALAVQRALQERRIDVRSINVFTQGDHARRSRSVFAKVFSGAKVGVISWTPPGYDAVEWWHSSERATGFLKESVGWLYEAIFNSGRGTNRGY